MSGKWEWCLQTMWVWKKLRMTANPSDGPVKDLMDEWVYRFWLMERWIVICVSLCFFASPSCILCGTPPCPSSATTTTSSLLLICWTSPWGSKPCEPSSPPSHTMANRWVWRRAGPLQKHQGSWVHTATTSTVITSNSILVLLFTQQYNNNSAVFISITYHL